ncbi:MAG: aminotransferase class I/II-fold pyridoxal phosphate-dependent enzyme [Actinomycetia bacterium]|nr:aminotransferase class I/II-fold pyridoxal phosphate-dependent enzyme [Actinomycetes bacterium]
MDPGSATEIALTLERAIARGDLPSGYRLASVRAHAAELGVAPGTVAAAFKQLADAGLIISGRGRQGTRVAPRSAPTPRATAVYPQVPEGLVDAQHGSPDPSLLPPLADALAHGAGMVSTNYGSPIVLDDLAAVAADQFRADGVAAEWLTVTNGSMDAVERILRAHALRPGDRVAVEDPGHIPIHQLVRSAGLTLVSLPVDDEGITPAGLERALAARLAAVVITPRAQNPTGAALGPARADALGRALVGHPEVVVIHDDHAGPVAGADFHEVAAPGPHWAIIRSVGKSLGPDLRLALVAGDRDTIDRISTGFGNGPGWVSHILQGAVAHLLGDPDTLAGVEAAAAAYRHRRDRTVAALAAYGIEARGRSGFNVWLPGVNEQATVDAARSAGFAILAGDPWRVRSESAVRISTSRFTDDEIAALAEAVAAANQRGAQNAASA